MLRNLFFIIALSACASYSVNDVPPLDTVSKRVVAATAQIQTIAHIAASLTDSGVLTSTQAETVADALQIAQTSLDIIAAMEGNDVDSEKTADTLNRVEQDIINALDFLRLFSGDRGSDNLSAQRHGDYGRGAILGPGAIG